MAGTLKHLLDAVDLMLESLGGKPLHPVKVRRAGAKMSKVEREALIRDLIALVATTYATTDDEADEPALEQFVQKWKARGVFADDA